MIANTAPTRSAATIANNMVLADAVPLLLGPLVLVSGLIPSVIFANKQAADSLVDAISGAPPPLTDSPPLRSAPLLFYPEPPRVADVLAVMARLDSAGLKKSSGSVPSVVWDNSKSAVAGGRRLEARPTSRQNAAPAHRVRVACRGAAGSARVACRRRRGPGGRRRAACCARGFLAAQPSAECSGDRCGVGGPVWRLVLPLARGARPPADALEASGGRGEARHPPRTGLGSSTAVA